MLSQVQKLKALFPAELHPRLLLVGGVVRDILSGIDCHDFDLIAFAPPDKLAALGFNLVAPKSTPNIFFRYVNGLGKVEVTALPSPEALAEDLIRRDFTVNAMTMTLDGTLSDPLGGRDDLQGKRLRPCSATSLSDDPARIFRALRFECAGFRLTEAAGNAIAAADWTDALARLPVERFSNEMLKALEKPEPSRFFTRMLALGVGANLLPELFRMPEVPAGPPEHHPEGDLFTHSIQVLEKVAAATDDPVARFCGMFHDLGKLATAPELYPKHHGHEEAGRVLAEPMCRRLRLPLSLIKGLQATCRLHQNANRWDELRTATKVKVAEQAVKSGIAWFLPLIVKSDCGREMPGWDEVVRVAKLNGEELGFPRGHFDREGIPPQQRYAMLLQRRVELLR